MPFFVEFLCLLRSLVDLARAVIEACNARKTEGYAPRHMGKQRGGSAQKEKDR